MTQKVAIVTDSGACIPPGLVEKYGIEVAPLTVIFGDKTYRDGIDISPAEFYTRLRNKKELPTTAHSSPGSYLDAFRRAGQRVSGILCITLSAEFSGQYRSAQVAKELASGPISGAAEPAEKGIAKQLPESVDDRAEESPSEVIIKILDCGTAAAPGSWQEHGRPPGLWSACWG